MKYLKFIVVVGFALIVFGGCQDYQINKENNSSTDTTTSESEIVQLPIISTSPFDVLQLEKYYSRDFHLLSYHIWHNEKIPTGIIVLERSIPDAPRISKADVVMILVQYKKLESSSEANWQIVTETTFSDMGHFGTINTIPVFMKIGPEKYAVVLDIPYTINGGYMGNSFGIYTVVDGKFTAIGLTETYADNTGSDDTEKYTQESQVYMLMDPKKEFYNLLVKTTTKHYTPNESIKKIDQKEELYIYENGEYKTK